MGVPNAESTAGISVSQVHDVIARCTKRHHSKRQSRDFLLKLDTASDGQERVKVRVARPTEQGPA